MPQNSIRRITAPTDDKKPEGMCDYGETKSNIMDFGTDEVADKSQDPIVGPEF